MNSEELYQRIYQSIRDMADSKPDFESPGALIPALAQEVGGPVVFDTLCKIRFDLIKAGDERTVELCDCFLDPFWNWGPIKWQHLLGGADPKVLYEEAERKYDFNQ